MTVPAPLDPLRRPSGAFAMVALDQRDSLRAMLQAARGGDPGPADVGAFKIDAARALSPHASAILLDRETGLGPVVRAGALDPGCALLVSADRLCQPRSGVVETTGLDRVPFATPWIAGRADAYKLLVIWRPERGRARREALVRSFLDACRAAGKPSVLEPVVRRPADVAPADWDHPAQVLAAARELAPFGPDLYKAEVPTHGRGTDAEITAASEALSAVIGGPWVVLSNGVAPDRFDDAVVAACRGGAAGFLAGRAIWTASLSAPDMRAHLENVAAPRLAALAARVDEIATARSRAA
jgi:sulfofructosephosphate aldolase